MTWLSAALGLIGVLVTAPVGSWVLAADAAHPDWPCTQGKVVTLTSAQMWDGPRVDDLTRWQAHEDIEKLVPVLASRRVPLKEASAAITRFAQSKPQDKRDDALKLLFAGLLQTINNDRAIVMRGIERFQRRQRAWAAEIEKQGAVIRELKAKSATDEKARTELAKAQEKYSWDVRVFSERQESMPLVCEVPVLLEQRLFELGREIRSQMVD